MRRKGFSVAKEDILTKAGGAAAFFRDCKNASNVIIFPLEDEFRNWKLKIKRQFLFSTVAEKSKIITF